MSLDTEAGGTLSLKDIQAALEQHKPTVLFLCQVCKCFLALVSCHASIVLSVVLSFS